MTSHKLSRKRIGQALGLLALGLALLIGSSEQAFAPAPATWTLIGWSSLASVPGGPHGPKGIVSFTVDPGDVDWVAIANPESDSLVLTEIVQLELAGTSSILGPITVRLRERLADGRESGIDPQSVDAETQNAEDMTTQKHDASEGTHRAMGSQGEQRPLRIFVGNFGSDDVSVVDFIEKKVVQTIKVGKQPTSLNFDPNSNKLYVNNFGDNSVSVIEVKATGGSQVIATITGFREPIFVRISPVGKRGYVSSQRRGEGLAVFDTATNTIIGRIDLPNVEQRRLALSSDSKRLYVAVRTDILGTGQIVVIDTESLQVLQRYRTESFPLEIAVTPNGRCLVVTHSVPNKVSLMDVSDGQYAVGQDPTAREPQSVAIIEKRAYVTNFQSDTISVFEFGEPCT